LVLKGFVAICLVAFMIAMILGFGFPGGGVEYVEGVDLFDYGLEGAEAYSGDVSDGEYYCCLGMVVVLCMIVLGLGAKILTWG